MFEFIGDVSGVVAGGVAGITGAGVLIGRQAKRLANAKAAYREVSDAFVRYRYYQHDTKRRRQMEP